MGQHTPKWAVGAVRTTPNPTAYDSKPQTDTERISAARSRAMADTKENNAPGAQYGFEYPPEYYADGCGVETSTYAFRHLLFLLYFLKDPKFQRASLNY